MNFIVCENILIKNGTEENLCAVHATMKTNGWQNGTLPSDREEVK